MGRKPWRKLWQDKLRSSPKWTRLRMADKGFWFECFQMAQEDGAMMLRPNKPLTPRDLAYEFRTRECTVQGWMDALVNAGLAEQNDGVFSLTGMTTLLQVYHKRPTGVAQHDDIPTGEDSESNDLPQNKRAPKEGEEKKRERKKKKPPKSPKGDYSVSFEKWWPEFPPRPGGNRGSKSKAFAKWKEDGLGPRLDEMLSILEAFKDCREWQKGYSPNVNTYLNQRLYEDPPSNGRPKPKAHPRTWPVGAEPHGKKAGDEWTNKQGATYRINQDWIWQIRTPQSDWVKAER